MTGRMLISGLAGGLMVLALLAAFQLGRIQPATALGNVALSSMDGREVFDADGATVGVVEQTISARQGDHAARYAMVRVSRVGDAGLRLAVPVYRLQPVEDGLMLTLDVDTDEADGDYQPTAALSRHHM